MPVMLKCGHAANAHVERDGKSIPCCAICAGISAGYDEIDDSPPDLSGRKARCSYCKHIVDSGTSLAFFEYRPTEQYDNYYCGCRGWD